LSAWKEFRGARWSLRVNPSSGNLHPTEAYVIAGPISGLTDRAGVYHYAPDRHVLEGRCAFDAAGLIDFADDEGMLIALTSIHWREAWKYGERAFRYCQHDLGHAIAALRIAAALDGLHGALLPEWSHRDIAALTGIDRDGDYVEVEREDPGCVLVVAREPRPVSADALLAAVHGGTWTGAASQLSEDHVKWTFIDQIAAATRDPGRARPADPALPAHPAHPALPAHPAHPALPAHPAHPAPPAQLILQRRSAVSLDGHSMIAADRFFAMLARTMPAPAAPFDALWWDARIHLAMFVHRVNGVDPGLYVLVRNAAAFDRFRSACGREFLWQPAHSTLPLFLLHRGDCRRLAQRLSCDQEIAADGFFSLGMIADFDASLAEFGPAFYRHLFWESGVVGQVLYLAAEAAGARGTGIGCFYDDPVHDVLGLQGHAFQSLYHFTVGIPVDDTRLSTAPGYAWESSASSEL
jgi:SagB-type dehydrogenase family enzyme